MSAPVGGVNPERMAWGVILGSFAVFVALLVAVPITAAYLVRYATISQPALLEPTLGTLLLYPTKNAEPIAVTTPRDDVESGSRIVAADESTQGTLGLINDEAGDEILGSIQIYPSTDLEIQRLRRPYFYAQPRTTDRQVAFGTWPDACLHQHRQRTARGQDRLGDAPWGNRTGCRQLPGVGRRQAHRSDCATPAVRA